MIIWYYGQLIITNLKSWEKINFQNWLKKRDTKLPYKLIIKKFSHKNIPFKPKYFMSEFYELFKEKIEISNRISNKLNMVNNSRSLFLQHKIYFQSL